MLTGGTIWILKSPWPVYPTVLFVFLQWPQAIAELQRAQPELREVRDRRVSTASVRSMTTKAWRAVSGDPCLGPPARCPLTNFLGGGFSY